VGRGTYSPHFIASTPGLISTQGLISLEDPDRMLKMAAVRAGNDEAFIDAGLTAAASNVKTRRSTSKLERAATLLLLGLYGSLVDI
jgi:hypothetical protein